MTYECSSKEAFDWLWNTIGNVPLLSGGIKLTYGSLADRPKMKNINVYFPGANPGSSDRPKKEDLSTCFGILERFNVAVKPALIVRGSMLGSVWMPRYGTFFAEFTLVKKGRKRREH